MKSREELIHYWQEQIKKTELCPELRTLVRIMSAKGDIKYRFMFFHDNVDGEFAFFALVIDEHGTWYAHRYLHPDQVSTERTETVHCVDMGRLLAPDESIDEQDLPEAIADFHLRNPKECHAIPDLVSCLSIVLRGNPA